MVLNDRINAFAKLGEFLSQFKSTGYEKVNTYHADDSFFDEMIQKIESAKHYNGWFTKENVLFAVDEWSNALTETNLKQWLSAYELSNMTPKTIGVIMAGNIPLVGFHDFLCVLISGHKILIKQSTNDNQLLPFLASYLIAIEPRFKEYISFTTEQFSDYDAIIATGSNNTSRYFEHYFGKVPHIIRKNRNSVAVLTGEETEEQLEALGKDIFTYYGLGCRNVSKIYVPEDYNFDTLFNALYGYHAIIDSQKYANNYDYNKAVYLMSNYKLFDNGFLMMKEDPSYSSPIATLFYQKYGSDEEISQILKEDNDKIQCIVGANKTQKTVDFGQTQSPGLGDYADGVDIIEFLTKIN
ncbi:acyl-CoA reductase [Aquimarina spongiae]|uniref:Acyl-CoA reductase (LuxC) n=1 Tax=Aquimarina spongiae TaxID=570521 RepID=A0A1M6BEH0_9FLAO|nr:acyl-CoA reductase [Aquimarina spongiae]SHI47105.1 Acyl-CoA reductase (LuxC) [Aquimarina spongiae]